MSVLRPETAGGDLARHRGPGRDRVGAPRGPENAHHPEDVQLRHGRPVGRRARSAQVSKHRLEMGRRQLPLTRRADLEPEEAHQRGNRVSMGPAHVQHGSRPGQEDEMQLPQPDAGGQEVAGDPARRSQETSQRGDGQMVDQAGLFENADARSEEAQQRRHENGEGGEVASGPGGVAQSEA